MRFLVGICREKNGKTRTALRVKMKTGAEDMEVDFDAEEK